MRLLVFHGYLLGGTGSNVYNANLAAALVALGHEVHLLCQDRAPERLEVVDAVGTWTGGALAVRARRARARCTVYRPEIGPVLPVYVADRYEGVQARPFAELDDAELDRYLEANVRAVRDVVARVAPDAAFANHLVMGPLILARALAGTGIGYAVKVHGSALEYTVKPHPRFLPHAREGLGPARAVLVGSRHTARSLWAAMDDPSLPARTRLGPPGVDLHAFGPREPAAARAGLLALAARLAGEAGEPEGPGPAGRSSFAADPVASAAALARLDPERDRIVAFVGKLIVSKGVDLLVAAWPLVLAREPTATLVVVGFGAYRAALDDLVRALADGDLAAARALAARGRAAEGGPAHELRHLVGFLNSLDGERLTAYRAAARALPQRILFTGRLEHDALADLLPAVEAQVVPSTFPEAFGMVAAEAAACGALPISADHSGLSEVSEALALTVPREIAPLLSFPLGAGVVEAIAGRVLAWLGAPSVTRAATRAALAAAARERYSWEGVARGVVAAAEGRLGALEQVEP